MPMHSDAETTLDAILARLHPNERRLIRDMAARCDVAPSDLVVPILAAYLRLVRDAPGAMPRDPLAELRARVR